MGGSGLERELSRTRMVEAAFGNERVTRKRVDMLEAAHRETDKRVRELKRVMEGRLLERLRWLLLGR